MISDRLKIVRNLPAREMAWLIPLFLVSGAAWAAILLIPFRLLAPCLGTRHGNVLLSPLATRRQSDLARRIGVLAASVARSTPWRSQCLVQAIMAKSLLNLYGIPHVLYLGVAKSDPHCSAGTAGTGTGLFAHAWLVVGSRVVTGAAGCNSFAVVSAFVSPPLSRSTARPLAMAGEP